MTGNRTIFAMRGGAVLRPLSIAAATFFVFSGLAGCDTAPLATEGQMRPPRVSELAFSPGLIEIDGLPPSAREGESVRVSISVSAAASDPDGDLDAVSFVIQAPVASSEPVAAGVLSASGGGRYATEAEVLFPAALTGEYVLIVYAADDQGLLGNEVRGVIELTASGNPPVIDSVDMPDRVQRPAAGQPAVPIAMVAAVSDPDGLANVARVEVRVNGGSPLLLCDDGGQGACNAGFASGDVTAGDGLFTLTIQVDSSNSPGQSTLEFVAVDRSGLSSDPVTRVLTIE
jgi:hypothetical protein